MGYSIRSRYSEIRDVSDKAARKAPRYTTGMWKSTSGVFHSMI